MAETNPTPPPPAPARTPLWMRLVLVASLAFNLLVIGMVGGAVLSGGGPGAAREAARDFGGMPFARALGPEDRRALMRDLGRERGALRESRDALRQRFVSLLAVLRADDFDRDALDAIVADQRAAGEARQRLGERLVLDRIAAMSPEARRAYADRLEADVRRLRQR